MKAIIESVNQTPRAIGFGSGSFLEELSDASQFCGLSWHKEGALRVFDQTCVHHEPATVAHEAQTLYEELGGQGPLQSQAERNDWLLARDYRKCESMSQRLILQLMESQRQSEVQHQHEQTQQLVLTQQLAQAQGYFAEAQCQLDQTRLQLDQTNVQLDQAQQTLLQTQPRSLASTPNCAIHKINWRGLARKSTDRGTANRGPRRTASGSARSASGSGRSASDCVRSADRFESHPVLGSALKAASKSDGSSWPGCQCIPQRHEAGLTPRSEALSGIPLAGQLPFDD